jgi:hypothetical protein
VRGVSGHMLGGRPPRTSQKSGFSEVRGTDSWDRITKALSHTVISRGGYTNREHEKGPGCKIPGTVTLGH